MAKFNFYLGAGAGAWLLAILVITAELIEPFKNLLKTTFGHHWIGKVIIVALAFIVSGFLLGDKKQIAGIPNEKVSWYSVIGSLVVIFLFFIIEFFK